MSRVSDTLSKNFSKTKEFQQLSEANQNGDSKKLVSLTLKKKDKIDQKIKDQFLNDEDDASYSSWIDSRPTTNLEKLHFITGRAIFMEDHIPKRLFRSLSTQQQTSIWSYWDVVFHENYSNIK